MGPKKVRELIRPFRESIPLDPCVMADDKITRAISLMIDNEVKRIAVVRNDKPIGFIRLEDALEVLGLPEE
jgi:predicted transcriptional regulator